MKRFLVIEEQAGSGCDYTIGCGTRVSDTEAESMEALLVSLKAAALDDDADDDDLGENFLHGSEAKLASVRIVEIAADDQVPLDAWRKEARAAHAAEAAAEKERADRAKLAELQAKYGAPDGVVRPAGPKARKPRLLADDDPPCCGTAVSRIPFMGPK